MHPPWAGRIGMSGIDDALDAELEGLRSRGLYRRLRRVERLDGARVLLDGRPVLVFGSNNYLGLARHPAVVEAAAAAAREWGAGGTGSRLTTGCLELIQALEQDLAAFAGTEAALVFPS